MAAELVRVETPPDERLLRFSFRKVRGLTRRVQVVVELMTNQWNALLLEGEQEWIRHLLWTRPSESRPLVVGQAYRPPEPSGRAGASEPLSQEVWSALMTSGPDSRILDTVAFTSLVNLPTLAGSERPDYSLWLSLRTPHEDQPCILETERGKQPYPVILNDFKAIECSSILDALDRLAHAGAGAQDQHLMALDRVDRALHRARGRVRGIEREMAHAGDPDAYREKANLLLARLGEVRRGATSVTLIGFAGEEVEIALDPALSPHENAEALYEEAARRERAQARLPTLLEKAKERVVELTLRRARLLAGDLSEEELERGLPSRKGKQRWSGQGQPTRLPFRRFRSSGGLEIRVGRGSKDNDALTFRHSDPDDVWLHARDVSGAHVVLRWQKKEAPPAKDLAEAAALAALHSEAKHSKTVPVDWTRRKHVRKPRKSSPGTVILSRAQTLFVEPDPDLPDRLSRDE
jgi:predicted ribosome quality control (RQC) complex YloA/Tae2 family protein